MVNEHFLAEIVPGEASPVRAAPVPQLRGVTLTDDMADHLIEFDACGPADLCSLKQHGKQRIEVLAIHLTEDPRQTRFPRQKRIGPLLIRTHIERLQCRFICKNGLRVRINAGNGRLDRLVAQVDKSADSVRVQDVDIAVVGTNIVRAVRTLIRGLLAEDIQDLTGLQFTADGVV